MEAIEITKRTLLTMLIIFNLALVSVNSIYATIEHPDLTSLGENEQNLGNIANSTNVTDLLNSSNDTQNIQNSTEELDENFSTDQQINKNRTYLNNSENTDANEFQAAGDERDVNNSTSNNDETLTNSNNSTENIPEELQAAAGETKTVSVNNFTINQIKEAAARVKSFAEINHRLPNFIQIATAQVKMSDFLGLMTESVLKISKGITSPITLEDMIAPKNSAGSFKKGNLNKAAYLDAANRINTFLNSKGIAPNYATTSLGKISYEALIYTYSKILSFYNTNKRLPNYVSVDPAMKIAPPLIPTPAPTEPANQTNSTDQTNQTEPTEPTPDFTSVHGIWLKAEDIGNINLNELLNANITDVFVKTNMISTPTYQTVLNSIMTKLNGSGIRIHAWITCFKDANGKWIDPANKTQQTAILNMITDIVKNYSIDGIHLDYVRYSGAGDNAAYKHNGTAVITSFVKDIYNAVKAINTKIAVSAAVMPEGSVNGYYYGQDYAKLAPYLDFIVPMIYKGNYGRDTAWIGSVTKYIVGQVNGTPVIAGLQTYESDNNVKQIPASELNADIKSTLDNGASGYALFRYGLIDSNFFNPQSFTMTDIKNAANNVKSFINTNKRLPNYVTIASKQITIAEFLRLMTAGVLQLNRGITTPVTLENTDNPQNSTGSFKKGDINKATYLDIANRINTFVDSNDIAPNYVTTSLGNVQFEQLVYMFSKILTFHKTNSRLPNYVSMDPAVKIAALTTSKPPANESPSTVFTAAQIQSAADRVKSFIKTNKKLPNYVEINSVHVKMSDFLLLMVEHLLQLNGLNTSISLKNVNNPTNYTGDFTNGNINSAEYMDIAQRIVAFINSNDVAPGYATTSLGKIPYESLIYMYSKILNFYNTNNRLPNYVSMSSSSIYQPVPVPAEMEKYLQATKNCQVNDPRIQSLAASLTQSADTAYGKATNIFNWVRDNIVYEFYYNTKDNGAISGAVSTLLAKTGNCVDTSHLLIALARAAGIPARYEHGTCTFTTGTYGHVWAQLWIDGKWYNADAISLKNTLGVINNWNTKTATIKGTYIELPF